MADQVSIRWRTMDRIVTDALGDHFNGEGAVKLIRTYNNRENMRGTCTNICNPRYLSQLPGQS